MFILTIKDKWIINILNKNNLLINIFIYRFLSYIINLIQ